MFERRDSISLFKDIVKVSSSNIVSLIESIAAGLIIPMILGATNFGYYRIFVLYSTYTTTFLNFGFIDGIVLKFSGFKYKDLNKIKFRSTTLVFLLLEFIISLIIVIFSIFVNDRVYSFIFLAVGIDTFFSNIYIYYQFISKATMDFGMYSIRNIIKILLTILLIFSLWILYKIHLINNISYNIYIIFLLLIYVFMFIICIYNYRNITFGHNDSLYLGIKRVIYYCKIGIYLTIAYQISNLILIIDNQIVSMFFRASTYGKYSFAYNIINAISVLLGAVSTVLLPHLRNNNFNYIIKIYHNMIATIMLVVYFSLLSYFPLYILVEIILPEYIQSLSYLRIFLPELGVISSITMITFNYYNALNKSKFYLYISTIVLVISAIIDIMFYVLLKNPYGIAFGSLVSIIIWYIISEYFLVKWYHIKWLKNFSYMLLMIVLFLYISGFSNIILGFVAYLIVYVIISFVLFKNLIHKNINILINSL